MSKKDDNQHSKSKFAAALTTIVGAAALSNLKDSDLITKGVPRMSRYVKTLAEDIADKRITDFDYEGIKKFANNHIFDENSTWKKLGKEANEKIQINLEQNNSISALVRLKEFMENPEKILRKKFNSEFSDKITTQLQDEFKDVSDKISEDVIENAKEFATEVLENNSLTDYIAEDGSKILNKDLIEEYSSAVKTKEEKDFFNTLIEALDEDNITKKYKEYADEHTENKVVDLLEEIKNQYTGKTMEEVYGAKGLEIENLGKLQNAINAVTGNIKKFDDPTKVGLTIDDFLKDNRFDDQVINIKGESLNLKTVINEIVEDIESREENSNIRNVYINKNLLKKDIVTDKIIDKQEIEELKDDTARKFAGSLFGKILKVTDTLNRKEGGTLAFFSKMKANPLAQDQDIMQILNKYYSIDKDNHLIHETKYDNMYTISSKHGTTSRMMKKIFGLEQEYKSKGKIADFFDFDKAGDATLIERKAKYNNILGSLARQVTQTENYNIIDKVFDSNLALSDPIEYNKNLRNLNKIFSTITKAPNQRTISRMKSVSKDSISKEILEAISKNNTEDMLRLLNKNIDEYTNKDLQSLIKKGTNDRESVIRMLSIEGDKLTDSKKVMNFSDLLRREAFKEVLIKESVKGSSNLRELDKLITRIQQHGIKGEEYKNVERLIHWGTVQAEALTYNVDAKKNGILSIIEGNQAVLNLLKVTRKEGEIPDNVNYIDSFRKTLLSIKNDYKELSQKSTERTNKKIKKNRKAVNDSIMMRKGYGARELVTDIIKDMNDFEKQKANVKRYAMQFGAGRNSREFITDTTMIPFFFTQRLIDPFGDIGLSFSNENTKNVADLWKNIMLKRVLPIGLGITAFNYADYEVKNITGTGIKGAFVQGLANVDLGARKVADITHISSLLKMDRAVNPITQYWFGDKYQDSKDRKEYYENGYSPVRKGRWWAFGSAAEYRGGKISYYQPSLVKRVNSDWRNIGIYGSQKEKWAHSWIPTPTHPFSTIRRLIDPYWLERKNYDERPYMETSPLFATGTPWGGILNATIGREIKPIKNMHKNVLGKHGVIDVRTLIEERNKRIKDKAINKESGNLLRISQDGIENVEYIPDALADNNHAVMNIKIKDGKVNTSFNGMVNNNSIQEISGDKLIYNEQEGQSTQALDDTKYFGKSINFANFNSDKVEKISLWDRIKIHLPIPDIDTVGEKNSVMNNIAAMNDAIKSKAENGTIIKKPNLARLQYQQARELINSKEDETDLLNTKSRYNTVSDIVYSAKELSGIYGFFADAIKGNKGRKVKRENAEKMSSFKRAFWDDSIGGTGGGIMEIARRFFPHDDHSWTEINNIRNKMPDWMPERFKTGDPYTKISKGEMRLPGRGYKAINKLHPDQYGEYGALDRMKILGDVAPWSDEYKLWKQIAQKEVTDPKGKKEIQDIKDRVDKQSRDHEFFNYKFLKNPTDFRKETIKAVKGSTIETFTGNIYNLAGIKKLNNKNAVEEELHPGMNVNVEFLKSDKKRQNVSAVIYSDGESINKKIVDSKMAEGDTSTAIGAKALTGHGSQAIGAVEELIAHAPIPYIHNKLLKVDSPLESYKNDKVYGTPYSTWEHPIKGFIEPALQKAWSKGPVGQSIALGSWVLAEKMWKNSKTISNELKEKIGMEISETGVNKIASIIMNAGNPGAFIGSMIASVPTGLLGSEGLKAMFSSATFTSGVKPGILRNSSRAGAAIMLAGYGITRSDKPIQATASFALAGATLANQLKIKGISNKEGLLAGAAVGLMISGSKSKMLSKNDRSFKAYIPKDTKKKWDIEEYFDRLEYIKYMGLYEKAAAKARKKEHVFIKKIMNQNTEARKDNQKELEKMNKMLSNMDNNTGGTSKINLIDKINNRIHQIKTSETILRGGKYAKAAVAYKQAANSTIYGLTKESSVGDILRALPKDEKEYFMEFAKEKDKKKQREILKYVSPALSKALKIAWGYKHIGREESNLAYFKNHYMPGTFWAGWRPDVDLEKVKIKTIQNEGMMLSDFGIYESQANEPSTVNAPSVGKFNRGNSTSASLRTKLISALNGYGLVGVKVSVDSTPDNVINVAANVVDSVKIAQYKLREGLNKATGTRMFYT